MWNSNDSFDPAAALLEFESRQVGFDNVVVYPVSVHGCDHLRLVGNRSVGKR
jgi:hypothetical protein